jgi:hypothetical protein
LVGKSEPKRHLAQNGPPARRDNSKKRASAPNPRTRFDNAP